MKNKLILIFLAFTAMAVCIKPAGLRAQTAPEPKDTAMTKNEDFFKKLDALLKAESFKPETVGDALGLKLDFKKTSENEAFEILQARAPKGGAIEKIELRLKRNGSRGSKILLNLSLSETITPDDVLSRFGRDPFVQSPSAHSPRGTPSYYVYSNPGGELRFGLTLGKSPRLIRVVLDRGETVQDK